MADRLVLLPGILEVTAAGNGTADVTVTVSAMGHVVSTTASVLVRQTVKRLEVAPAEATFTSKGDSQQFTVTALDAGGTAIDRPIQMAWGSSDPAVLARLRSATYSPACTTPIPAQYLLME